MALGLGRRRRVSSRGSSTGKLAGVPEKEQSSRIPATELGETAGDLDDGARGEGGSPRTELPKALAARRELAARELAEKELANVPDLDGAHGGRELGSDP